MGDKRVVVQGERAMQRRINRTAHSALLAALMATACAAMLAAPCAHAMNKCVDENGHMIFTDRPCSDGSKKKDVSDHLKSTEKSSDPASVVAQYDAQLAAYLATPKSVVSVPFKFAGVALP
jgi:hypothetical protein